MHFFRRRPMVITILSIIFFIVAFIVFYQYAVSHVMEVELKQVEVDPLKKSVRSKDSLNMYGLNQTEKEKIINHIDDYKKVTYTFEIKNTSPLADSVYHRVQPLFSEDTRKLIVVSEKQLWFPRNIPSGESYTTYLTAIIKTAPSLSDQEILNMVSKDRFTITGGREVWSIPFGDESVTVGPLKKN